MKLIRIEREESGDVIQCWRTSSKYMWTISVKIFMILFTHVLNTPLRGTPPLVKGNPSQSTGRNERLGSVRTDKGGTYWRLKVRSDPTPGDEETREWTKNMWRRLKWNLCMKWSEPTEQGFQTEDRWSSRPNAVCRDLRQNRERSVELRRGTVGCKISHYPSLNKRYLKK